MEAMRVLIVGGTRFVGWHITLAALGAGHHVTLLHRGTSSIPVFTEAEHILADRNGDLSVLDGRAWDAVIDVSAYHPRQVEALAKALGTGAGRYVFISSVSAYDTPDGPGFTESSRLLPVPDPLPDKVTNETYGALKVACEQAARKLFGATTDIVRPTYVIGPRDHTGRFDYWVRRIAEGGRVLAPGDPAAPLQVIDARDLGVFVARLLKRDGGETFHTVSPPPPFTFGDMIDTIVSAVGPLSTTVTWVDGEFLAAEGIGEELLPLWPGDPVEALLNTGSPAAAYAAGLNPRPLVDTIMELHGHLSALVPPPSHDAFLSREREAELLARWNGRA
jgi:nucleoside-diphosphate-sugar epimerase